MSNVTINPDWLRYNAFQNEGGEGYNPHRKWIAKAAPQASRVAASSDNRMLRDESGNLIPARKLAARLATDEARLLKITDETARRITQAAIDHARAQLG